MYRLKVGSTRYILRLFIIFPPTLNLQNFDFSRIEINTKYFFLIFVSKFARRAAKFLVLLYHQRSIFINNLFIFIEDLFLHFDVFEFVGSLLLLLDFHEELVHLVIDDLPLLEVFYNLEAN